MTAQVKSDPEFEPSPEELKAAYDARFSFDPKAIPAGVAELGRRLFVDLPQKIGEHEAARFKEQGPLSYLGHTPTQFGKALVEGVAQGSAGLGQLIRRPAQALMDELSANLVDPGNQELKRQMWLDRTRAAAEENRLLDPYFTGEQAFIPGTNPGMGAAVGQVADVTNLLPAARAAGLLGKIGEAGRAARTAASVAAEAASKGGALRTAAGVAAPIVEQTAETTGRAAEGVAKVIDKAQPIADVAGLVTGGLAGIGGAHVAGRAASTILKWASKMRDMGTGLRAVANTDWKSSRTIYEQLAKSPDSPVWLKRAASSKIAPLVEATLRVAGDAGRGAAEGALIGSAGLLDDTLTPEEKGAAVGQGIAFGAGGASVGRALGGGRRAELRQAHDIAVRMDRAIKAGADPAAVLGASDAVMFFADNIEHLFRGAMPGGKDLNVVLADNAQFKAAGQPDGAVASFAQTPDGQFQVTINIENPNADARILHEGVGHALAESVVMSQPEVLARVRAAVDAASGGTAPTFLQAASEQYARALHPEATPDELAGYITDQRRRSAEVSGDSDAWILSELWAEAAVRAVGGRSVLDLSRPSFLGSVGRFLAGDRAQQPKFDVSNKTFFGPLVSQALDNPDLQQSIVGGIRDLGAYRPGVDEPSARGVRVRAQDVGAIPQATLHDLGSGRKGNDFAVQTPDGRTVARPPAEVRKLSRNRRRYVDASVPLEGTPAAATDTDPTVKLRRTPAGMVERSGTRLGQWFYGSRVFSETSKALAKTLEAAMAAGQALGGWYHQIGESLPDWKASVAKDFGNLEAQWKDFVPVAFKISKVGNLLTTAYSLTAFSRKAAQWSGRRGPVSLELWNGDVGQFTGDTQTYLANHRDGRPGADGIGEAKRDVINAFLVGGNRSLEARNPLRPLLRGQDAQGIVRSYRLDRMEPVVPSDMTGFEGPQYNKQVLNLSPDTRQDAAYLAAVERGDLETAQKMVDEAAKKAGAFWHGTPSGDLRGGTSGLHVGTHWAATQALEARIGIPSDGKGWDGTREYGKTLLAGRSRLRSGQFGQFRESGYNAGFLDGRTIKQLPENDFFPGEHGFPKLSDGTEVDPAWKPWVRPVLIVGKMSGRKKTDSGANRTMKKALEKGTASEGVFYINEGEDAGSVSAALPSEESVRVKLADPVTRDDSGKVIPLSQRFDPRNSDIRFSPDTSPQNRVDTLPKPTETPNAYAEDPEGRLRQRGSFRVVSPTGGVRFHAAISVAKAAHPFGAAVDLKPPEAYAAEGTHLFLAPDDSAGVAVTGEKDLVSVFKRPGSKANVNDILAEAAPYSLTLDGFDIGGFLPNLYAKHGFRPAARLAFNPEFAPPGWDLAKHGTPDVVFMVRDPEGKSGLPTGDYNTIRDQVPLFSKDDFDGALVAQQAAKAKVAAETKFSPDAGDVFARAFRKNSVAKILQESEARSGPFDGGCLIAAKAIHQVVGEGDIVRMESRVSGRSQDEHYGVMLPSGEVLDAGGVHPSAEDWVRWFSKKENLDRKVVVKKGVSAEPDAPDDPVAVKRLVQALFREQEATMFSPATDKSRGKKKGTKVVAAAVRSGGKVFRGVIHADAVDAAAEYFGVDPDDLSYFDGFVDDAGNFLNREQAAKLAVSSNQVDEKGMRKAVTEEFDVRGKEADKTVKESLTWLEASQFEAARKFSPDVEAPKTPITDEELRSLDSVGNKQASQVDPASLTYVRNPVPGSVALAPRWGLVNRAIAGMPRSFAEVKGIVARQVERLKRVIEDYPEFARKGARFYSDMAESAWNIADSADPTATSDNKYNLAELMLRFLALGSPRTAVAANATKAASSFGAPVSGHVAGLKIGYTPQQVGARHTFGQWKEGKPFDMHGPGVDNKVRNFYLNGLAELLETAEKAGHTEAANALLVKAADAVGFKGTLDEAGKAEVHKMLDGLATVDMWDMAAKGFAWPGFLLRKSTRNDPKRPFQWTQDKFAVKSTVGGPAWKAVVRDLGVTSPADLTYQQARALRLEGNNDWTEKTWLARRSSPFTPETEFTYFTRGSESGLSPGGAGPLYDAQQAIDGLIADELNRAGMAGLFGKDKLKVRNAQEILWALERRDNPYKTFNKIALFGDTFSSLAKEISTIREGGEPAKSSRGARVLEAIDNAFAEMANQDMPIEVVSSGTTPEARLIQDTISNLEASGVKDAVRIVTESVADGLHNDLNRSADELGLPLNIDTVKVGEGGYTEADKTSISPNIVLRIRGAVDQVRLLLESMSRAMDQDGGNVFRKPTIREINDPKTKLNNVVTFNTTHLDTSGTRAFFEELNAIKGSDGKSIFTGFTSSPNGMVIGDQYYQGDMLREMRLKQAEIARVLAKHNVFEPVVERYIIDTFFRGTPESDAHKQSEFAKRVRTILHDRIKSAGPRDRSFPQQTDVRARTLQQADIRAKDADTERKRDKLVAALSSQLDAAVLRGTLDEITADAIKAEVEARVLGPEAAQKKSKKSKKEAPDEESEEE